MTKGVVWGVALATLFAAAVYAQGPGRGFERGQGLGQKGCSNLEALDLSEAQREALLKIDRRYKDLLLDKRKDLMIKRLELHDLLKDPDAKASAIRQKSLETGRLHNDIRQRMIEYQIEIREVLSAEQIRRWCTLVGIGIARQEW